MLHTVPEQGEKETLLCLDTTDPEELVERDILVGQVGGKFPSWLWPMYIYELLKVIQDVCFQSVLSSKNPVLIICALLVY